ncbi:MAG: hypothetical protein AAGB51_07010 [Planctomycetota bacterium]
MRRILETLAFAALVMTGAAVAPAPASALAPEPDPVPRRWQLDVELGPLRATTVQYQVRDSEGVTRTLNRPFLFLTYSVANYTGEDLLLAPQFELAFDNGQTLLSGAGVPNAVTEDLLSRLKDPLIEDQIGIVGVIAQGEQNARDGVVIWPLPDLKVDEVAVYAAGFSGETDALELIDPTTGEPVRITLRKTLVQRYQTPGVIDIRGTKALNPEGDPIWQMR